MKIDGKESKFQIGQIHQYIAFPSCSGDSFKDFESPILAIRYDKISGFSYLVYDDKGKEWVYENQIG